MQSYITSAGGAVLNPHATSVCEFCTAANTNTLLESIGIDTGARWWNYAVTIVYSVVNVGLTLVLYWRFRVPRKPKLTRQNP
jgi:ABC-type multidrug transport system permease subunit